MSAKRWPLVVAIAAYFVAVVIWLAADRRVTKHAFDTFSAASTDATGVSLAARSLHAKHLTKPLAPGIVPRNAVVFRLGEFGSGFATLQQLLNGDGDDADDDGDTDRGDDARKKRGSSAKPPVPKRRPRRRVTQLLTDDEEEFVRRGGRLVLAIGGRYASLDVRNASAGKPMRKVFPLWPGLDTIAMPQPRLLAGAETLRRAHTLYTVDDSPAAARIAIGSGDVLVFAQPELFDNGHIASAANLGLLNAIAAKRPAYFDETIHGLLSGGGALDLLKEWRLGPFLLLLLAIAAAVFWRYGTRIGEPEDDYRESRSEAVDLVRALGALYDRSMSDRQALVLYRDALSRTVAATSGLRGEQLQKRVAQLTGGIEIDGDRFREQLATLNHAFEKVAGPRPPAEPQHPDSARAPGDAVPHPTAIRQSSQGGSPSA